MKAIFYKVLCLAIVVAGCKANDKEPAESLLRDPAMQEEIFNAIIQDSTTLSQFFEKLRNENGHPMMRTMHGRMMRTMYSASKMDSMMMTDPPMRNRMLRHMLNKTDQDSAFCVMMGDSIMRHRRLSKMMQQNLNPPGKRK